MKTVAFLGFFLPMFSLAQNPEAVDLLSIRNDLPNPIIFGEGYVGLLGSELGGGVSVGGNLNWQFHKRDLLTARAAYFGGFSQNYVMLSPFTPFPIIKDRERVREYGVLYGKRYVFKGSSFSFSGGIAYYDRDFYKEQLNGYTFEMENYFGFPFEFNYKIFKTKKQRFRAYYGIVPIGKRKVAFGRSIGLKLYGNFSRNTHIGLGLTYGFGTHKEYVE
jgi:hypothetical protein